MSSANRVAALVLEDGRSFVGRAFGAPVEGVGEVVFNTAMTGYQEVITDPSYAGQMVCMTYPLQGNYGVNQGDPESYRPWVRALIVRWLCERPSNWRAAASLDEYLAEHGIPGIAEIDTRALTRHLRSQGALRAVLSQEAQPPTVARLRELQEQAKQVTPLSEQDLVAEVSRTAQATWHEPLPAEFRRRDAAAVDGATVAVIDYGLKNNTLRSLRERGFRVVVLPHTATFSDVRNAGADGLLLSNGPGDPALLDGPVELCTEAIGRLPIFGICLGHQILGRAIGGTTSRLPFGHHGANHPVQDLETGRVHITSQNHEFQVDEASLPEGDFFVSQRNLNDGSVEGLSHRSLPVFSVQYHPEGAPGPQDNQWLFDRFADNVAGRKPKLFAVGAGGREKPAFPAWGGDPNPKRPYIPKKVLIIGSGPIVIGQAAEFDYAGSQACKALREEGIATVLVNSNPATIMTDEEVADRVYIEPLTLEAVTAVIERERPDAVLPTLGGQTGLNLAVELADAGVFERYGVRLLGTPLEAIRKAEDREAFKRMLEEIGEPVPESGVCHSFDDALEVAARAGYPLIVRPAYTLGGTGGGIARDERELRRVVESGISASPINQVLVERSLIGWKEIEYEVMRDAADTCITVCNMENLDPMGVHTGDSIVVAPSQTLTDRDYQMLRTSAIRIIRTLGIEGGCNVQFALDPKSAEYHVIEVNPRVSRSSALASKATGYPIARVAAKIAAGRRLDEIVNAVTGRTRAAFEPAIDYCVVKIPRWPFDKFPNADRRLTTQMKSTGEVMAIERTFEAALAKALRSLEQRPPGDEVLDDPALIEEPNDRRLFALLHRLAAGETPEDLARRSQIDRWFLERMAAMKLEPPDREPVYKLVDTCAAEFEAATPYFYSCFEEEDEAAGRRAAKEPVVVLGSGPIRIGQGIEFDYCSVHAAWALRDAGRAAIMVNSNPETVSTDFDTSDRLYFEPLDTRAAGDVVEAEDATGVVVQFGGQTAINLASQLQERGLPIPADVVDAIDLAEDRRLFAKALEGLGIPQPVGDTARSVEAATEIAERIGYPVLVRPSYVLGGRAMEIVRERRDLERYMRYALGAQSRGEVLVDKYLQGVEVEVDAVTDGETVVIPGVMQHVERAGVHSGDSFAVYPAPGLEPNERDDVVDYTIRIAQHFGIRGLLNIQFVVHRGRVYVLEVNPRASRTVPFLSKVTGVPMVRLATRVMLGERLADHGWETGLRPAGGLVAVKAPVFSMAKLSAVDSYLGPEMKSTGEVMGVDRSLHAALQKAFLAAGLKLAPHARALLTIADVDKPEIFPIVARLVELGCPLIATEGTAATLRAAGFSPRVVAKIGEEGPTVLDVIERGEVDLVINTMSNWQRELGNGVVRDGFEIRRAAVERRIPCLTSLDTAAALLEAAVAAEGDIQVRTITEWRNGD